MSGNVKRNLIIFVFVVTLVVSAYNLWFTQDAFSPEELNSLLQSKDEDVVKIRKVELTSQSIQSPYLEPATMKMKNWDLQGNSIVKNYEMIRITSDNPKQVGSMFAKEPIQAESFEMELTFHIHGKSSDSLSGDGMAIWFLDRKSDIGDVFGVKNNFKGLGIMIDTYKNGKRGHFPLVNLMLGDGQTRYNKGSDGYESRLASCTAKAVLNPSSGVTKARIVYIKNGYFSLDFNYNNQHEDWTNCVTIQNLELPPIKYLGLSAETGALSENVDIFENRLFALYKPDGNFIGSIDELQQLMKDQETEIPVFEDQPDARIEAEEETMGGRHRNFKKKRTGRTRKSIQRLKLAEKRIKQKQREYNMQMYGDPDSNIFKRTFAKIKTFIRYIIYFVVSMIALWFSYIVFRIIKQKRKNRPKAAGLLD